MQKPRIMITLNPPALVCRLMDNPQWKRLEEVAVVDHAVITDFHKAMDKGRLSDVDYLFGGWGMNGAIDEQVLEAMPKLKGVAVAAGTAKGLFTVKALIQLRDRGVQLSNSGYVNGIPVAEYCLAMILMANKNFFHAERIYCQRRKKIDREVEFPTAGNYGKTVGLVTASSRIGQHLLNLLRPYRLNVLAESRSMSEAETASYGARKVDLETIFRQSDVVSLHTPSLPATRGMIDGKYFAMMKDGATLINSARGAIVNAEDMLAELKTGRINAILDVTDPDEPLAQDSELWDLPNVVLTPHIAGSEGDELHAMGKNVVSELTRMIMGKALQYSE